MHDEKRALVLNADYQPLSYYPLSTVSWEEAICAVVRERANVVAEYDDEVRSPTTTMKIPSVIALREYYPAPKTVAFTRFNVFLRDGFRCQYRLAGCLGPHGEVLNARDLTFDHVKPRHLGGKTEWTNIVAACRNCNTVKDNKLIVPITKPTQPSAGGLVAVKRRFPPNYLHETWLDFLYWDVEIEG